MERLQYKQNKDLLKKIEELTQKIMVEIEKVSAEPKLSLYIFYTGSRLFFNWAYPEQNSQEFIDYPPKYQMQEFEEEY